MRRPSLYGLGIVVPALDLLTQLLLVVLGFALVFSPHVLAQGTSLGTHPSWHDLAFALPLAMLAFTGLETVANLAEEARRPGVDLPRSVFGAIATVVTIYVAIAVVALSASRARHRARHRRGSGRRCSASRTASAPSCRTGSATRCGSTSASPAR